CGSGWRPGGPERLSGCDDQPCNREIAERQGDRPNLSLLLLRAVHVRGLAEEDFGRLHYRLRRRRMRVDGELDVAGERGHLDGKHALGDQLTGARAADAYAEHALGLGIDDEFRHAVGAIERDGAATRRPWEARDFDLA